MLVIFSRFVDQNRQATPRACTFDGQDSRNPRKLKEEFLTQSVCGLRQVVLSRPRIGKTALSPQPPLKRRNARLEENPMSDGSQKREDPRGERQRRLAEALRANLQRRKTQQRKRAAPSDADRIEGREAGESG
jgi:hypothetical protein